MNKGQTLGRAAVSLTILLALPTMLGAVAQSDPQTPFFCGIHAGGNYGVFDQGIQLLPDTAFEFYESINANWIGFGVTMALEDSMDSTVGFTNEDSQYPAFEEWEIRQFVQAAKERGFQIYLQLSLTMNAEQEYGKRTEGHNLGYPLAWQEIPALTRENWPWDPTHPDHEAFVAEFFASYTAMVLHYARIAEEEGIGMLAVGIELNSLFRTRSDDGRWSTEFRDEIKGMVDAVREVYSGLITYELHYSVVQKRYVPGMDYLWGDAGFDVIGISAYFPLLSYRPSSVPSVSTLAGKWQQLFDQCLAPLAAMYPDKPLVFLEMGYFDMPGSSYEPLSIDHEVVLKELIDEDGNGVDDGEEEQANIYQALFQTIEANPGVLDGVFNAASFGLGVEWSRSFGGCHRSYHVRERLVEDVVREWYGRLGGETNVAASEPIRPDLINDLPWDVVLPTFRFGPSTWLSFINSEGSEDMEDALYSKAEGNSVSRATICILDDGVACRVDLQADDAIPPSGRPYLSYTFEVFDNPRKIYITLRPADLSVHLSTAIAGQEGMSIGVLCNERITLSGNSIACFVPMDLIREWIPVARLAGCDVRLMMDRWDCTRRELYFFPGVGNPSVASSPS